MKISPLPFSQRMIAALKLGRKTQTRRIAKWKPREPGLNLGFSGLSLGYYSTGVPTSGWILRSRDGHMTWHDRTFPLHCPHGRLGDRLWVREALRPSQSRIVTYVDDGCPAWKGTESVTWPWKVQVLYPRYMPKWACRFFLELTDVRLQRLHEIDELDALAEGFEGRVVHGTMHEGGKPPRTGEFIDGEASDLFAEVWDQLNGDRGYTWESNPWVFALTFKLLTGSEAEDTKRQLLGETRMEKTVAP